MNLRELLVEMRNFKKVQGTEGTWNADEYMRGMYNGIEVCLSAAEEREPVYKDAPK